MCSCVCVCVCVEGGGSQIVVGQMVKVPPPQMESHSAHLWKNLSKCSLNSSVDEIGRYIQIYC